MNDALGFWWIPLYTWRADRPMRVIRRLINARGHGNGACVGCVCVSRWMLHGVVTRPIVYRVAYVTRVRVLSMLSGTTRSAKESRSRIPEAVPCITSDARHAGEARDLGNQPNTNESVLPHTT